MKKALLIMIVAFITTSNLEARVVARSVARPAVRSVSRPISRPVSASRPKPVSVKPLIKSSTTTHKAIPRTSTLNKVNSTTSSTKISNTSTKLTSGVSSSTATNTAVKSNTVTPQDTSTTTSSTVRPIVNNYYSDYSHSGGSSGIGVFDYLLMYNLMKPSQSSVVQQPAPKTSENIDYSEGLSKMSYKELEELLETLDNAIKTTTNRDVKKHLFNYKEAVLKEMKLKLNQPSSKGSISSDGVKKI